MQSGVKQRQDIDGAKVEVEEDTMTKDSIVDSTTTKEVDEESDLGGELTLESKRIGKLLLLIIHILMTEFRKI